MKLNNDILEVTINAHGAEVKSIKMNDIEYLWQSDPKYWGRSSPVLFPIVGRLLDNEYRYEGKTYQLSQHGFARDFIFDVVESSNTSALFLLKQNEETLRKYPFTFNLFIGYELRDNELVVSWKVENTNDKEMYFQIGAHPAFNFLNGSIIDINQTTNYYVLNGTPYVQDVLEQQTVGSITVDNNTFVNDALVYDNLDKVVLRDESKAIELESKGFPFFGIWSTVKDGENAPFICLEPWHGIADCAFHDKELTNKKGINVLSKGEVFKTSYTIKVK